MSRARHVWTALLVVVVAVHLAALYWPRVTIGSPVANTDKAVHLLLFAVPVVVAARVFGSVRWPMLVFALHAPVSEVVQAAVLPGRSGDPVDAVFDLAGVVIGGTAAWWWASRRRRSGAPSPHW